MKANRQERFEAKQLFDCCLVNGMLDENRARQVLQRFAASKPRGYLGTLSYFLWLVKLEAARHTAKVESATELSADLQASVRTELEGVYGRGLVTSFAANPSLIGGMRIQVGSDVYDGSVKAKLAELEQSF